MSSVEEDEAIEVTAAEMQSEQSSGPLVHEPLGNIDVCIPSGSSGSVPHPAQSGIESLGIRRYQRRKHRMKILSKVWNLQEVAGS